MRHVLSFGGARRDQESGESADFLPQRHRVGFDLHYRSEGSRRAPTDGHAVIIGDIGFGKQLPWNTTGVPTDVGVIDGPLRLAGR